MQQDKLTDTLKQRLDSMNEVPAGFSFNQQGTWDKLEKKLADSKKKVIAWWYYAAAAILFAIIAFVWFLLPVATYKVSSFAVYQPTIQKKATSSNPPITVAVRGNIASPKKAEYSTAVRLADNQPMIVQKSTNFKRPVQLPVIATLVEKDRSPMQHVLMNDPEPMHVTAVIAPVKRRFKVAHINDQDDDLIYNNVALDNTPSEKRQLFNFTLRSQYRSETSAINSSPKKEGGLFKATIN